MSLGESTKCDLCANSASIDREALINVLQYTFCQLRNEISDIMAANSIYETKDIDKLAFEYLSTKIRRTQFRLNSLAKTAELLHTLIESKTRKETIWG